MFVRPAEAKRSAAGLPNRCASSAFFYRVVDDSSVSLATGEQENFWTRREVFNLPEP